MMIAPSDVEHTFVILARGPDLEWAFIRLSRNAIRFSTPPSRWDETLLSFQPRTLNSSRLLAAVFFPWRMLTWESRVFEIAFWIASRVLSRAWGRSPERAGRPAPAPEPEPDPVGRPGPPRPPLLPPRPPVASMSMSPSRSVRIGPRLRMPPRSPPERRDFMVFMLARENKRRESERCSCGKRKEGRKKKTKDGRWPFRPFRQADCALRASDQERRMDPYAGESEELSEEER